MNHRRYVESGKGSVFILCSALPEKYPRQPVRNCHSLQPRQPENDGSGQG